VVGLEEKVVTIAVIRTKMGSNVMTIAFGYSAGIRNFASEVTLEC
jgi:hypothetical protein